MERDLVLSGKAGQGRDIIDNAVGEVGCGANNKNGIGVNQTADSSDIDLVFWSWAGNKVEFDLKVIARLVKRSVSGMRDDPFGLSATSRK